MSIRLALAHLEGGGSKHLENIRWAHFFSKKKSGRQGNAFTFPLLPHQFAGSITSPTVPPPCFTSSIPSVSLLNNCLCSLPPPRRAGTTRKGRGAPIRSKEHPAFAHVYAANEQRMQRMMPCLALPCPEAGCERYFSSQKSLEHKQVCAWLPAPTASLRCTVLGNGQALNPLMQHPLLVPKVGEL